MPNESLPTVYLETSVISYLTARPSRDLLVAAHQQVTHRWWDERRDDFQLYISQVVDNEIRKGDPNEIEKRLALVSGIDSIEITIEAADLAKILLDQRAMPAKAEDDAVHVALATLRGIDYLTTWNMKHLANATVRRRIDKLCERFGYVPPAICTPEELFGVR